MYETDFLESPCAVCGYSSAGYWQRETHSRECPWHYVGGKAERLLAMRAMMPKLKTVDEQIGIKEKES